MTVIIFSILIFLELLWYVILFDVLLSWLSLFGISFRPKWLADIIDPLYSFIRKYIPTRIGAFDFTPIILVFLLMFLRGILLVNFPEVALQVHSLMR